MSKSKKVDDSHIEIEPCTRFLAVQLTDAELMECARRMAEASEDAASYRAELKTVTNQIKAQIDEAEARMVAQRTKLRSGYEYRDVPCTLARNYTEKMLIVTRDDLKTAVESRPMRQDELQIEIEIEDAE